ncbi:MAG: RluA family pseudouridine synthase [Treponema sp.]|nr:RluA family pseudouridine synthase [Treponema sp.]
MKATPNYSVIYSDDDIIVLNKKSGLCVAADRYDEEAPRLDLIAQEEFGKLFAVHRIDKDTSGIVVYARNEAAHKNLCDQFAGRKVHKIYHCLVRGRPLWSDLKVTLPLMPDGDARHRTVVNKTHGKESVTDFRFIGACGPFSWLEAKPLTGRTHQIRAHLSANNLSIVCDPLYSGNQRGVYLSELKKRWNGDLEMERPLINRLALHAWKISFTHPTTNAAVQFEAPYPKDLEVTRKQLAKLFGVDPLQGAVSLEGSE